MFRTRRAQVILPFAALVAFVASAPVARADREVFTLDGAHTQIGFKVRHFVSKVGGQFKKFSGTIEIDRAKPSASTVDLKIEAASIDTGNESRDKHLNSPDFFDTAKFPELTFKSTKIEPKGKDVFEVTGDLTIKGVTKTAVLTVTSGGFTAEGARGQKAGFEVTGKINRKDFGVNWNNIMDGTAMLGDDVDIAITVEANKKKPEAAAPAPAPAK
jgi:polyisoprenoid-binding protein YceI